MDNEKIWYPKYPSIHVSKENGYPCIQVSMYPSIHDIQVSNYPSIQRKSVSKISMYPDIWKKWYPSIPSYGQLQWSLYVLKSNTYTIDPCRRLFHRLVPQFLPRKQHRSVAKKEGEVFSTEFSYVTPIKSTFLYLDWSREDLKFFAFFSSNDLFHMNKRKIHALKLIYIF